MREGSHDRYDGGGVWCGRCREKRMAVFSCADERAMQIDGKIDDACKYAMQLKTAIVDWKKRKRTS